MERGRDRDEAPGEATAPRAPGKVPGAQTKVAARYGASLARALPADTGDSPATIHDAATAAVENKDGGQPVDAEVADKVGAHLGADLSGVRVHQDPLAQEATSAMGARAFAYGADVFLGANEAPGDLGLMAHELTHVVQQGAAGQRTPQRQVQVGDAGTPAEHQADAVASAVTGGTAAPAALIVDDGPVGPSQMLKSTFLEQLRAEVTAAASAELGPMESVIGCPYIDQYFGRYASRSAAEGEALLRRYSPATHGARTAAELIPAVVARVREGVRAWRETGQPPADLAAADPAAAAASATPAAPVSTAMGPSQPLDGAAAARIGDAYGESFADVRIHTGPEAARFADQQGAMAVTAGRDIAFSAGAYAPGAPEGDALLAHELAHVAQQSGDAGSASPPLPADGSSAHEDDADQAAGGALQRLWGGMTASAKRVGPALRSPFQLQRCPRTAPTTGRAADLMAGTRLPSAGQAQAIQNELSPGIALDPVTGTALPFADVVGGVSYRDAMVRELDSVRVRMLANARALFAQPRLPMSSFDGPSEEAKRQVDAQFGSYRTGNALTSRGPNPNLIDRSAQPPDAEDLVRYLIHNQSELLPVHSGHNAIPSHASERAIIAPLIVSYATAHRTELEEIDRSWPGIAGGGVVQIQPFGGTTDAETRTVMWEAFQTMIHEYLHTITHPNFELAAGAAGGTGASVLSEGFTSLFTDKVWQRIHPAVIQGNDALRNNVEGRPYPFSASVIPAISHYDQIAQARNIEAQVGEANCRAAYFLGHAELLGLGRTYTPAAVAQGNHYLVPAGVATLAEVATRTGADAAAIATANGLTAAAVLTAGQQLTVPGIRIHLVRSDGTERRAEIAREHGLPETSLDRANPGTNWAALTAGQPIVIPVH